MPSPPGTCIDMDSCRSAVLSFSAVWADSRTTRLGGAGTVVVLCRATAQIRATTAATAAPAPISGLVPLDRLECPDRFTGATKSSVPAPSRRSELTTGAGGSGSTPNGVAGRASVGTAIGGGGTGMAGIGTGGAGTPTIPSSRSPSDEGRA